jgi:hypothetical protein
MKMTIKNHLIIFCLFGIQTQSLLAQKNGGQTRDEDHLPDYSRTLVLEAKTDTTANVSFGDFDGDGHLDILLVKGRHWPIIDRVLIGDGLGGIRKSFNLGEISDRSYTGGLADFNGDDFLDIAVSNDNPDRKLIYFNDGKGNFTIGSEFGLPKWPTRNLSIADINRDGWPDLILANRGGVSNYICLNMGKGKFNHDCISFAPYPSTTITPADLNHDGFIDLVVPHRNGGQSYIYPGSADLSYSDNHRIPFGPADAKIRMASVADFNSDDILDIVVIDETKGVNLYLGQKDQSFALSTSLGDSDNVPYALTIADLNNDNMVDIIAGYVKAPSTAFINDGKGNFKSISFGNSDGTVYGFAVADFNEDGIPDIATGCSDATSTLYFGHLKIKNRK